MYKILNLNVILHVFFTLRMYDFYQKISVENKEKF